MISLGFQVYLVEIADTQRRGIFGASGAMSVSAGITITYVLGVSFYFQILPLKSSLDKCNIIGCEHIQECVLKRKQKFRFFILNIIVCLCLYYVK